MCSEKRYCVKKLRTRKALGRFMEMENAVSFAVKRSLRFPENPYLLYYRNDLVKPLVIAYNGEVYIHKNGAS